MAVVLITGANKGIGAAHAREFAKNGDEVIVAGRNLADCQKIATEIGHKATAIYCDLANRQSIIEIKNQVEKQYKKLDVLINNAGTINPIARFKDADPAEWELLIKTNLIGQMQITHCFYELLQKANPGRIINILSGAARAPINGWSAYCSSKAAFLMLTRCLHLEAQKDNILCFGFAPGIVNTNMQVLIKESPTKSITVDEKDLIDPKIAAQLSLWLASGQGDDLSGEDLDIRNKELQTRASLKFPT